MSASAAVARIRLNRPDLRTPDHVEVQVGYSAPNGFLTGALLNCRNTRDLLACLEALRIDAMVLRSAATLQPAAVRETLALVTPAQVVASLRPDSDLQDDEYLVTRASSAEVHAQVQALQVDPRFR